MCRSECQNHLEDQEGNERISHTEMREMGSISGKIMELTEDYVQWSVLTSMVLKVWILLSKSSEVGCQSTVLTSLAAAFRALGPL